jgi:predicted transcriptional regulator
MKTQKQQFKLLEEILKKNKNIKQKELHKKLNMRFKISQRDVRRLIYAHRLISKEKFISASNKGYNLVDMRSNEFKLWFKRYSAYIKTQVRLLNSLKK